MAPSHQLTVLLLVVERHDWNLLHVESGSARSKPRDSVPGRPGQIKFAFESSFFTNHVRDLVKGVCANPLVIKDLSSASIAGKFFKASARRPLDHPDWRRE